jgi:iron complex outermembrane receptor protein
VVASAAYTLPVPEALGKLTIGGSFVYQSRRRIVSDGVVTNVSGRLITSGAGIAPSSKVFNLNATLENLGGYPVDVSGFITNLTNEHVILQINDNTLRGFISSTIGEPRMWGVRIKYRFGQD